jgi:hypothetical protein
LSIGNPNSFTFPTLRPTVIAASPTTVPNTKPADPQEELLDPETDSPLPKVNPVEKPNQINDSDPTRETNNTEITDPPKDSATSDSEIPICPIGKPLKDC